MRLCERSTKKVVYAWESFAFTNYHFIAPQYVICSGRYTCVRSLHALYMSSMLALNNTL